MSSEEEDVRESRQLKLPDKAEKKPRDKSDKKWIGLVLFVSILLSLGFYFIAGNGMEEVVENFRKKEEVQVRKPASEMIVPLTEKLEKKSMWDKLKNLWGPAVYEF